MKLYNFQELQRVKFPKHRMVSLEDAIANFKPRCKTCKQKMETHAFGQNRVKQLKLGTQGNVISVHCENQHCPDYYREKLYRG